ncbi:hypothetical protein [Pontibacter cellulosilyticus]|uniref:Uncharacterized protein n=1 Tax=Pontibacter cellulosilyticus TaxID=1720253 RepID=A0A923N758_9BACT|nr:hypothetical protein [Pontibacter cellulosilyticus]MBC5993471.1 hypothetical protein [Pontibacter cellulosilyticus]
MPNPQESKIEDFAFDYLQGYYTSQQGAKNVLISRSEKNKQGIEVEGMFTFKHPDNTIFLATVTFKNSQKLTDLLTAYKKQGLNKLRFLTPVLLLMLGVYASVQFKGGIVGLAVTCVAAVAGFILHTYLLKYYLKRRVNNLLDVLKMHQSNEQWLGLSISSLVFRNNNLASYFLKLCQRRGIGVITVGKRAKVVLMQEPRTNVSRKGDFLSHYVSEHSIRKAIQDNTILRVA